MINILILDDNQYKREVLKKFLQEFFKEVCIDEEIAFNSGIRRALRKSEDRNTIEFYDFIFLDDKMPRFTDAMYEIEAEMAEEALRYLWLREIPSKCIISSNTEGNKQAIAHFEEIGKEYEDIYIGQIDLNPYSTTWHKQLENILNEYKKDGG